MSLSSELISQFVKVTKDEKPADNGSTVYGTIVEYDGKRYVKLDGSDQITPITTTTDVLPGERVSVLIKNHTATVTGNISSPAARTDAVKDVSAKVEEHGTKISEFEIVVADMVTVDQLNATQANINTLLAEKASVEELNAVRAEIDKLDVENLDAKYATIESLNATNAEIEDLETRMLTTEILDAKYATIENLDATNVKVNTLESTYGDFSQLTTERLDAVEADIEKLDVGNLDAKYATVEQLNATNADVDNLEAEVADIDTLIFGSATGTTIQTSFANAVIAQLGNAQIKSAMIDTVSADKINAGDINTNNVRVVSEDGRLVISDETIQISDATRVRVQIGKDSAGDYSISIWDADGNLMFSEGGITDSAIKEAIIRNDMVSEDANISASKLDISSLFTEINGSTETIKATKIYLDDEAQTLDVAFTQMSSDVSDLSNDVSSQCTRLSVVQGQIESKVWQQDIDTAKDELGNEIKTLTTKQSSIEQTVDGLSVTVSEHTGQIANKADSSAVTEVSDRVTSVETSLDGFKTSVSETYVTKTDFDNLEIGGRNFLINSSFGTNLNDWYAANAEISVIDGITCGHITGVLGVTGYVYQSVVDKIDWTDLNQTYVYSADIRLDNFVKGETNPYLALYFSGQYDNNGTPVYLSGTTVSGDPYLSSYVGSGWVRLSWVVKFTHELDLLNAYVYARDFEGDLYFKNLKLEKGNKATDWSPAPEDMASAGDLENYATKSEVEQTAESITSTVSATYTTKEDFNNLEIGGINLLENSAIEVTKETGTEQAEFIQFADLAPIFDEHGLIEYTLSFDIKSADTTNTNVISVYCINGSSTKHAIGYHNVNVTTEYTRHSFTFTPTIQTETDINSMLTFYGTYGSGNIPCVTNVKLEKGDRATDWTPAPEDAFDAIAEVNEDVTAANDATTELINSVKSEIRQLADSIAMLVTDANGESLMTQTATGWTFSTKDIQDKVDSVALSIGQLEKDLGDSQAVIDALSDSVDDFGVIAEYVKIGTYTYVDDEGIEQTVPSVDLFETDSGFKLKITNTAILFTDGTSPLVSIDSTKRTLTTPKAVLENELQIGGSDRTDGVWIWNQRSNGNLGLSWKAVSS